MRRVMATWNCHTYMYIGNKMSDAQTPWHGETSAVLTGKGAPIWGNLGGVKYNMIFLS